MTQWELEARDVAAEASAPDSLAPCATEEFEIVEPDQLDGALEVDAFWDGTKIGTIVQSAIGQKVCFQILLHFLKKKKQHPGKQCPTLGTPKI